MENGGSGPPMRGGFRGRGGKLRDVISSILYYLQLFNISSHLMAKQILFSCFQDHQIAVGLTDAAGNLITIN